MCFPMIGAVVGLLGSAVSAVGQIQQGKAAQTQANYNAEVARQNSRAEINRGNFERDKMNDEYSRQRASARVAAAGSGIDASRGSAAFVINEDNYKNQYLDESTAIWNARSKATAYENKARDFELDGQVKKQGAMFGAAGTFLGGLGGFAKSASSSFRIG